VPADDLPLVLDRARPEPLAVQLAEALRSAAGSGALRVGDRLSSTRALASRLGVSRTVTAAAYDQLLAEGWLSAAPGAGTFLTAAPGPSGAPAREGRGEPSGAPDPKVIDLAPGRPCLAAVDGAAWRRAWRAAADTPPSGVPCYAGLPEFRAAVVDHLLRHRGLVVGPDRVVATAGSTAAVAELAALLPPGSRVALEEPGYQRAAGALAERGLTVVPAEVDAEGLRVDRLSEGLAAVYCTPAHQFPLGSRLSARRRVDLVRRARAEGFLVLEDDYDGELRYDVAPLPLVAALDPDVVVHLGTASKLLTPTLGVGWLVAPPWLLAALLAARERTGSRPAPAGQQVFTELAGSGDLARHLRRLRRELTVRRELVVAGLGRFGVAVRGDAAGAHVLLELPSAAAEQALVSDAAAAGIGLDGLLGCHQGPAATFGVSLGYAAPSRAELTGAVEVIGRLAAELTSG
jgi:GntR family transcriptional regulator/MocR family aminotransferase